MGAFVGTVTSPFHRRRKGRIGRTVFDEKVAPDPAPSSTFYHASANRIGTIVLHHIGSGNYWRSLDQAGSWTQFASGGTSALRSHARPPIFDFILGVELFEFEPNFLIVGRRAAATAFRRMTRADINGQNPTLRFEESSGVINSDINGVSWSPDGNYFCAGAADANDGIARVYVGVEPSNPTLLSQTGALGFAFNYVLGIWDEDFDTQALFILSTFDAQIRKLRLKHEQWTFTTIANPLGRKINCFIQRGPIILGSGVGGSAGDGPKQIIRSTDYGETFSIISVPNATGDTNVIWDNFGKFFAGCTGTSKLIESRNGITWIASTQPSGNKRIDAACNAFESSYFFSADIGTFQCYKIRRPAEI